MVYTRSRTSRFSTWSGLYRAYSDLEINNGYMLKKKVVYSICRFCKAYDKIPRNTLLNVLKKVGCGNVMLKALASLYKYQKAYCV